MVAGGHGDGEDDGEHGDSSLGMRKIERERGASGEGRRSRVQGGPRGWLVGGAGCGWPVRVRH